MGMGFQIAVAALTGVVLFLHALQGFSREVQKTGGEWLRRSLGLGANQRGVAFLIGAGATALLQSSSATSSLAVALVDSGVIGFRASLGILLGANVGTTVTAWLVSFKLTGIGPFFIIAGTLLSLTPLRFRVFGKAVFYFGLIFFTLDLIAASLAPLHTHPGWQALLEWANTPWSAVLVGAVATALVQSSSVVVGLAVLLAQQGLLPAEAAISMALGSNIGTTSTALIASATMRGAAKLAALANVLFNTVMLVLLLPVLPWIVAQAAALVPRADLAVALTHLAFNLAMAMLFLPMLRPLDPWLRRFEPVRHAGPLPEADRPPPGSA